MKPQVYHVDAFTSQPFRGNSAGVVFPADNLSEAQMQLIARELGHSAAQRRQRCAHPLLYANG
jgi:PhzF family phenazine biosynthesis protein